ncbi:MAG: hypothetical protein K0S86_5204, partial [Geminicoccaceae bacterium]|nr:hypothetical protein [Geminicoccaceae bacterium]
MSAKRVTRNSDSEPHRAKRHRVQVEMTLGVAMRTGRDDFSAKRSGHARP